MAEGFLFIFALAILHLRVSECYSFGDVNLVHTFLYMVNFFPSSSYLFLPISPDSTHVFPEMAMKKQLGLFIQASPHEVMERSCGTSSGTG